ncbi:hypothetical protein ABPG74_005569 [Tetrahymena malaccensis]
MIQQRKNKINTEEENAESINIQSLSPKLKEQIDWQQSSASYDNKYSEYQQQDEIKENQIEKDRSPSENLKTSQIQLTTINTQNNENDIFQYSSRGLPTSKTFQTIQPQFLNANQCNDIQEKSNNKLKEKIEYYSKKLKQLKDGILQRKAQMSLFNLRYYFTIRKRDEVHQKNGVDFSETKAVQDQVNQTMDVLQLFRDLILLKKAVMVMLSKQQIAALQLVGCSANFQNPLLGKSKQYEYQRQNHFQMQYTIQQSQNLQEIYIKKFLERCSRNKNLSEIDQRILSSLSQCQK